MDTNGSIGTTNQKAHISLKSLHVQDKGTFQMKTYTPQNQFTMIATNLTVSQMGGNDSFFLYSLMFVLRSVEYQKHRIQYLVTYLVYHIW